jgi:hypothetical protein
VEDIQRHRRGASAGGATIARGNLPTDKV